jgi:hypothetical protein
MTFVALMPEEVKRLSSKDKRRVIATGTMLFRDIRDLMHGHHLYALKSILFSLLYTFFFETSQGLYSLRMAAHELARLALSWDLGQSFVWVDPPPNLVSELVARNLAKSTHIIWRKAIEAD